MISFFKNPWFTYGAFKNISMININKSNLTLTMCIPWRYLLPNLNSVTEIDVPHKGESVPNLISHF